MRLSTGNIGVTLFATVASLAYSGKLHFSPSYLGYIGSCVPYTAWNMKFYFGIYGRFNIAMRRGMETAKLSL